MAEAIRNELREGIRGRYVHCAGFLIVHVLTRSVLTTNTNLMASAIGFRQGLAQDVSAERRLPGLAPNGHAEVALQCPLLADEQT
jgi:hypothetical protein